MSNVKKEFIQQEIKLALANTSYLYGTVLSINVEDADQVQKLVEEAISVIETNQGWTFDNFNYAVKQAIPAATLEIARLQEMASEA